MAGGGRTLEEGHCQFRVGRAAAAVDQHLTGSDLGVGVAAFGGAQEPARAAACQTQCPSPPPACGRTNTGRRECVAARVNSSSAGRRRAACRCLRPGTCRDCRWRRDPRSRPAVGTRRTSLAGPPRALGAPAPVRRDRSGLRHRPARSRCAASTLPPRVGGHAGAAQQHPAQRPRAAGVAGFGGAAEPACRLGIVRRQRTRACVEIPHQGRRQRVAAQARAAQPRLALERSARTPRPVSRAMP